MVRALTAETACLLSVDLLLTLPYPDLLNYNCIVSEQLIVGTADYFTSPVLTTQGCQRFSQLRKNIPKCVLLFWAETCSPRNFWEYFETFIASRKTVADFTQFLSDLLQEQHIMFFNLTVFLKPCIRKSTLSTAAFKYCVHIDPTNQM